MNKKQLIAIAYILATLSAPPVFGADDDMPGSRDHPDIPRIEDSYIIGYAYSDYDEGVFIDSIEETGGNKVDVIELTEIGKRTRIVYVVPSSLSNIGIRKNYEEAFAAIGEVTEHFSCRNDTCPRNLADEFIWPKSRRIPTPLEAYAFYNNTNYYQEQSYWHATVAGDETSYRVSVFSAQRPSSRWNLQHFVHLEVVESEAFESALEFVDADEMSQQMESGGRVALYGIQFDFDSAKLKESSDATLNEIAKALENSPDLGLYVVGHTDNDGSYEYNRELSERRAQVVVNRLVKLHGIEAERLTPVGVGPVAPVAANDSEDGKALNRRVELVRR